MRLSVEPSRVELGEDQPFTIAITVTNTQSVIAGFAVRILGADPSWVDLDAPTLSLFPDTTQTLFATIDIPSGVGAGDRRIAVQVRETTPPQTVMVQEIELVVPGREAVGMTVSPLTVTCGKKGRFSVVATNNGNKPVSIAPAGTDAESAIDFTFTPRVLDLAPGEHVITDLRARGKRRWFGTPVARPFGLTAVSPAERDAMDQRRAAAAEARKAAKKAKRRAKLHPSQPPPVETKPAEPEPPEPLAQATMVQKPRIGRGLLALLSLLLAVSVFAVVITIAMSRLVGVSAADRDLAIQVANAKDSTAAGTAALGGTVTLLSSGDPAPDITVEVFSADDLDQPVLSTATDQDGGWEATSLTAGDYKIRFQGADIASVWYPKAPTSADATALSLNAGQHKEGLAVALGGLPATVSGTVKGDDVAGSTLTVMVPVSALTTTEGTTAGEGSGGDGPGNDGPGDDGPGSSDSAGSGDSVGGDTGPGGSTGSGTGSDAPTGAVLKTITIGPDGTFDLSDLPSPAQYILKISKPGYAPVTQRVDLVGGQVRGGINMMLRKGDSLIKGTVTGPDGPVGNAVVTATSGNTTVRTLSLTEGDVGAFTLRGLTSPATYTVTVTKAGFSSATSTLSLTAGQQLSGVLMSLSPSSGTLSGTVTLAGDDTPATGVSVTVATGAKNPLRTVTQSGDTAGEWSVAGLPIPGTYTLTFSRDDLQPQTVSVAMNAAGVVTSGAGANGGIDVAMQSAFATVSGTVRQHGANGVIPVGEATVTLSSGDETYHVTSASTPSSDRGAYDIGHVAPGTYTMSVAAKGTKATTVLISVTAGQKKTYDPILIRPASVSGSVTSGGAPLPGAKVVMYVSSQYPAKAYATTTADASGHYSFSDVDAPQAYVVQVESSAGAQVAKTVVLQPSEAATVNLAVTSTSTGGGSP